MGVDNHYILDRDHLPKAKGLVIRELKNPINNVRGETLIVYQLIGRPEQEDVNKKLEEQIDNNAL